MPQGSAVTVITREPGAADVYRALTAQREVLGSQLEELEGKREDLSDRLEEPMVRGADREGLETRIRDLDQRIAVMEKQITATDAEVARAAGVPGATSQPPRPPRQGPPEEVYALSAVFIVIVLFPISVAFARRIWRRSGASSTAPAEVTHRLTRIEQAVDAIAVEVERVGEGQRYVTQMFADQSGQRALGAGAAEPIELKAREASPHFRR